MIDTYHSDLTTARNMKLSLTLLVSNSRVFGSPRVLCFRPDPNPEDAIAKANLDCVFRVRVDGKSPKWFTLVATRSTEIREAFVQSCKRAGTFILAMVVDGFERPELLAGKIANLLKHALRHSKRLLQRKMSVRANRR